MQVDQLNSHPELYVRQLLEVIGKKAQGVHLLAEQAELCAKYFADNGYAKINDA